ncbi:hypothetical protein M422DRAFT_780066 [Sphaerobolus stellatus SS14]|uniref:Uncharacterized protein n=1 Tax=Sphaerobolus stellatus (strain SS14) TaxID=990650 RepID=A0A0C9VVF0_SPHS4|nr:hypothetical protein M422DRAFT_780066 [Sphaerobolus stellatus SS14]
MFSDCGCEHTQFGTKKRQTAYNYTECLAHAEVISLVKSGKIRRICGYFVHNEACKKAVLSRIPPIPVHPSVYVVALKQLHEGASLTAIQARNRELFCTNGYPRQPPQDQLHNSQFQWIMKSYDTRALYQQYNRMIGIDTMKKPQINIDDWLDPQSPHYNATLAEAVFHYSPQAALNEYFEVCIATKEMKEMAWNKLLLFIVMAVDEKKKSVPLTFLLFSAPSGNKQISSGYDTAILTKLLQQWQSSLEKFKSKPFDIFVAVTDTDYQEAEARVQQLASMDTTRSFLPEEAPIVKAAATVADILSIVPDAYMEARLDEVASKSHDIGEYGITDDIESVSTDAEDELDFTLLNSSRQAIDAQSMACFAHEARIAAPKLEQVDDLLAFRKNVALLHKINHILPSGNTSKKVQFDSALTDKENMSLMPPTQCSCTVTALGKIGPLPPSPEKSQKRKQSYSRH